MSRYTVQVLINKALQMRDASTPDKRHERPQSQAIHLRKPPKPRGLRLDPGRVRFRKEPTARISGGRCCSSHSSPLYSASLGSRLLAVISSMRLDLTDEESGGARWTPAALVPKWRTAD